VLVLKSVAIAILVFALAACGAPRPRPFVPQPQYQPAPSAQSLPAPGLYKIDADNSELRLLVYRAGPLAALGHNHVMVTRAVTGTVELAASISESSFSLSVPAASFVVDDMQWRLEEGDDFQDDIPEDAKSITRRRMLGTALLNAAEYPEITVKTVAITDAQTADVVIGIAGRESHISVPFALQGDADHLWASGSMELRQTAIGLKPYSLLGGALQVQDAMVLKFKINVLLRQ
jgi:polyisoprenoid-binding protein YceI